MVVYQEVVHEVVSVGHGTTVETVVVIVYVVVIGFHVEDDPELQTEDELDVGVVQVLELVGVQTLEEEEDQVLLEVLEVHGVLVELVVVLFLLPHEPPLPPHDPPLP